MAGGVDRPVARGDIWYYRFRAPDKRRPVVVLTRSDVLPFMEKVLVCSITPTIRGLPSEVAVGAEEGLEREAAVNLDNVHTVWKERLEDYVATLSEEKVLEVCHALATATGCEVDA